MFCFLTIHLYKLLLVSILASFITITQISGLVFYCKLITSVVKLSNAKWHPKDATRNQNFFVALGVLPSTVKNWSAQDFQSIEQ